MADFIANLHMEADFGSLNGGLNSSTYCFLLKQKVKIWFKYYTANSRCS